ncbi:TIR domain-containing protein [Streptomyces goshikiensis]|uniref:TIR domain-containing protein n=1 Tax=Streptomyces goshikiensis TaxID=1942 RepID=UPI0036957358
MERDAFISYSHKRDTPLAQALQRGLHTLARPWTRRQIINVFRDTTSLAANSDLGGSIKRELEHSRHFIYLASPAAAESRWVREEIAFWLANRPVDRFLIAVSDGDIAWDPQAGDFDWARTTALPDMLRGAFPTEPLWVDLTAIRRHERFSLRHPEFRDAVATLAAPLHGRAKEALDSEDLRQRRRALRMLRGAVAALSLLLVATLITSVIAWQQRGDALARARTSASQALAARALVLAGTDPRKAAQFALYAEAVQPTGESAQALGRAVESNENVVRHVQGGNDSVSRWRGAGSSPSSRVALSRSGRLLAYYSDFDPDAREHPDRHIHLYDIGARKELPSLYGGAWPRNGGFMAFSADGSVLAAETYPNEIDLWDTLRQKRIRTVVTDPHADELASAFQGLASLAVSDDGQRVAAIFHETPDTSRFGVWDVATGARLATGENATPSSELAFSTLGRLVLLNPATDRLDTLSVDDHARDDTRTLSGLGLDRGYASLTPDGAWGYVRNGSKAELWDLVKGKRQASVAGGPDFLAVPQDAGGTAIGADGRVVSVYDMTLNQVRTLSAFSWPVDSLAVSGDGKLVAASTDDGAISLFSTERDRGGTAVANPQQVKAEELIADGRLAVREVNGGSDLWAVADGAAGLHRLGHVDATLDLGDSPGDTVVASADGTRAALCVGGMLSLWDLSAGAPAGPEGTLPAEDRLRLLAFVPDGTRVLARGRNTLYVLDTRTWETVQEETIDEDFGGGTAVSLDGTTVAASVSGDLTVWRWSRERGLTPVRTAAVDLDIHNAVFLSRGGEKVAVADGDLRITLVDVASGRTALSPAAVEPGGRGLVFSRDLRFLVQTTGSGSGSRLGFWDASTGEARGSWALGSHGGAAVLATPSGDLLTLGADGALAHRTVGVEAWRKILCGVVRDPLPKAEYDRYLKDLKVGPPCGALTGG